MIIYGITLRHAEWILAIQTWPVLYIFQNTFATLSLPNTSSFANMALVSLKNTEIFNMAGRELKSKPNFEVHYDLKMSLKSNFGSTNLGLAHLSSNFQLPKNQIKQLSP